MASASDIGASASSYEGSANLGGGSFGFSKLDTRPIEELAKYTMLYNRSEYDQRQKDTEAVAREIAVATAYDLTSGIPKDAKLLQEKYDKLISFIKDNPGAVSYRNKDLWTKFKTMQNDLKNDLETAKVRNMMYMAREKEIADTTDAQLKDVMRRELDDEIAATDIRTPLKHSQKYGDFSIKLPDSPSLTFDVVKTGPNATIIRDFKMFNVPRARGNSDIFELGLENATGLTAPEKERQEIARKKNFWIQGSEIFNSTIQGAITTDANGNKVIDESKLNSVSRRILNLAKETNKYLEQTKADIKAGVYKDKFENKLSFGDGVLDESDYTPVNVEDGVSPAELALIAQFAQWSGDTFGTKVQQTDNAIQLSQQAVQRRGQDLDLLSAREGRSLQRDIASGKLIDDGNTQTTGNSFDEIGDSKDVTWGSLSSGKLGVIRDGYVIDYKNQPYSGEITIPASQLPAGMVGALKTGGTVIDITGDVKVVAENGVIKSVATPDGGIVTRQNMENAQKKFDTEQKGQQRTLWGRRTQQQPKPTGSKWDTYRVN